MITILLANNTRLIPESVDPGSIWYVAGIEMLLLDTPALGWLFLILARAYHAG